MGMVSMMVRVRESEVQSILDSPEKVRPLLIDEDLEKDFPLEEVRPPGCLGFLLRLTPITISQVAQRPEGSPPPVLKERPDNYESEVWDELNFLFTGTAAGGSFPEGFIVDGGETLDIEDDEIDAEVRLLRPDEVRTVASYLNSLTDEELTKRVDPPKMIKERLLDKRYTPEPDGSHPFLKGLLDEFGGLKEFITETATKGDALIVTVW